MKWEVLDMYRSIEPVNGFFHAETVNRKFSQGAEKGEADKSVFLRRDIAAISPKGKAMGAIERLMKQKDFIRECKDSLLAQMADTESGICRADLTEKIEEYEKQLDSLDKQIAKELAKQPEEAEKPEESNGYKGKRPLSKQELNSQRMAELTELSAKLKQSEVMDSVKNRMEGEKAVLEAELKSGDSERKRQRIAEIDDRTAKLSEETFAEIGETLCKHEEEKEDKVSGTLLSSFPTREED